MTRSQNAAADIAFSAPAESGGIARVSVTTDLQSCERTWRAFQKNASGHVFQTFDFVAPWCAHVAKARAITPHIVIGHADDGQPLFLLPFGVRRQTGSSVVEWLGGEHADYHGGLFDPEFLKRAAAEPNVFDTLLDALRSVFRGVDLAHFIRMPMVLDGTTSPFARLSTYPNANHAHATVLGSDWTTYYKQKRGSGWRRTDRKKVERMAERGDLAFRIAEDEQTVEALLSTLFAQKRTGLERIGVADMFAPDGVRDFYRALALTSLSGDGAVQLSGLWCGDDITAVSFGLVWKDTYYYILHSYDLEIYAAFSAGAQLMHHLMQWCIANDITIFDFTIGDEPYKEIWCETQLELFNAAVPLTAIGRAAAGTMKIREAAKSTIKGNAALWSAAVEIRKRLLKFRA